MKKLVVYYTYTAGNTERLARRIATSIGADIAQIEMKTPYAGSYADVVKQGELEVRRGFTPELKALGKDPAAYDEIVIGTPTWWYDMAPAVLSFMRKTDFRGKSVAFFQTDAGWAGDCLAHMEKEAEGATVLAKAVFGFSPKDGHRDEMVSSEDVVDIFASRL